MKNSRAVRVKVIGVILVTIIIFRITGLYMYFCQENYFTEFSFRTPNISLSVNQLRLNIKPELPPEFRIDYGYRLRSNKCLLNSSIRIDVLFLVKSSVTNFDNRMAIRETWGLENRFTTLGYNVRLVFLLALPTHSTEFVQSAVDDEQRNYGDILQGDFVDEYYNNTLKTLMGFKFVKKYCQVADFIMFVDDDFYISTKNVLRLLNDPLNYPGNQLQVHKNSLFPKKHGFSPFTGYSWYTGHLFFILPVRFYFNKFFVSLEEYPYNVFPPFINAGAFIVTRPTLVSFYYAAMYTPLLKLDDVYVGILAKKLGVVPTHNRYFYPYRVPSSFSTYENLIASHGYRNHLELLQTWNQQLEYGNV